MDENLKAKADPTILLILDYLAVGVILAIMFYMSVIAKDVSPVIFFTILTSILSSFGLYKGIVASGNTIPRTNNTNTTTTNTN